MNLSGDRFINNSFLFKTLAIVAKLVKETGFLPYCLVKCITCLLDRGYHIITYEKLLGVPINILSSVFYSVLIQHSSQVGWGQV